MDFEARWQEELRDDYRAMWGFGIVTEDLWTVASAEFAGRPTWVRNRLFAEGGYRTMAQVALASDKELLSLYNFGKTALKSVRAIIPSPMVPCPCCGGTGKVRASPG